MTQGPGRGRAGEHRPRRPEAASGPRRPGRRSRCSEGRAAGTASDAWGETGSTDAGDSAGRGCLWRPRAAVLAEARRRSRLADGGSHADSVSATASQNSRTAVSTSCRRRNLASLPRRAAQERPRIGRSVRGAPGRSLRHREASGHRVARDLLGLLLIILFIPIRRYSLEDQPAVRARALSDLRHSLAGLWATFLLLDPAPAGSREGSGRRRWRFLGVAVAGSIFTNFDSITQEDLTRGREEADVLGRLHDRAVHDRRASSSKADVRSYLRSLVVGSAILGAFGVVEWKTGTTPSRTSNGHAVPAPVGQGRSTRFGAGSRERTGPRSTRSHSVRRSPSILPIAAVLRIPRRKPFWYLCAGLIVMGTLAVRLADESHDAGGRRGGPRGLEAAGRAQGLPFILPMLVAIQIALPGTFATVRASFFPSGGLVEQQAARRSAADAWRRSGRRSTRLSRHPFFGRGFGTRIVETQTTPSGTRSSSTTSGSARPSRSAWSGSSPGLWIFLSLLYEGGARLEDGRRGPSTGSSRR